MRLQTQWRTGYEGLIGLDYNAVSVVFNLLELNNRQEIFDGLQVMEFAALKVIRAKKD